MKVLVRNFGDESFEIEVKPEDTVADVKKTIESKKVADRYPAGRQMLIHKGEILKDGTTMEENGVAENSSIFFLAIPEPEEWPPASATVHSGQASSDVPAQPQQAAQPSPAPSTGPNTNPLNLFPEVQALRAAPQVDPWILQLKGARAESLTFTREENEAIERLEAMGFPLTAVLQAFLACDRNEELTVNYLLDHHDFDD